MSNWEDTAKFLEKMEKKQFRKTVWAWIEVVFMFALLVLFLYYASQFLTLMAPRVKIWHMEKEAGYLLRMLFILWFMNLLRGK